MKGMLEEELDILKSLNLILESPHRTPDFNVPSILEVAARELILILSLKRRQLMERPHKEIFPHLG